MLLRVNGLAKSFGIEEIFSQVDFFIDNGDKVGLIGANGMGKSTLVKCIVGEMEADAGNVNFTAGVNIGYLKQGSSVPDANLWEVLLTAREEVLKLREQMRKLELATAHSSGEEQNEYIKAYTQAVSEYESLGGYSYESLIRRVAYGLGFAQEDFEKNAQEFSGGQKTRILLACALIRQPDLLILDEPTNHLDIPMLEWLEGYLTEYSGGLLLISHDRYFLDRVTNKILLLQNCRLQSFKGNYTAYLKQYTLQVASREAAYLKQQQHIEDTEEYIRRYKAGIKSKQARGRQSQLSRLERLERPVQLEEIRLRLPEASMTADKVLILQEANIGYDSCLIHKADLLLRRGERVALIGVNGAGKTCMIKTIIGEVALLGGSLQLGNRVQIGYFAQEHENLADDNTLLDELMFSYSFSEEEARTHLAGVLFRGDEVFKQIKMLSGGERARIALLKLMLDGANFLILDEPTNHLDVLARQVLEETLNTFTGSILVVSHDRYFLDLLAQKVWEVEGGRICEYLGNYSDYKSKRQELLELKQQQAEALPTVFKTGAGANTVKRERGTRRKSPLELRRQAEKLELSIREQEGLMKVLEYKMSLPENHVDVEMSSQIATEHADLKGLIDELLIQWEDIMMQIEDDEV